MESMGRKKPRRRRSFTPEFKAEIVELCQRCDRSVGQVAKDFDLTETAVREWVRQAELDAGAHPDGLSSDSGRSWRSSGGRTGGHSGVNYDRRAVAIAVDAAGQRHSSQKQHNHAPTPHTANRIHHNQCRRDTTRSATCVDITRLPRRYRLSAILSLPRFEGLS